jgi:elongation factor P--(R)-beta-lysine ligase
MLTTARNFFTERGVLEVETPALCAYTVTDPHISSIPVTTEQGARWLRTSPEYHMKRLLAAGSGDIYQIGKAFRGGESGRNHQPEFTLLEWYRLGFSIKQMAQETCELITALSQLCSKPVNSTQRITYRDAFLHGCGIDPFSADTMKVREVALRHSPGFDASSLATAAAGNERQLWLDLLAGTVVYPALTGDRLWIVDQFPADQAMLARLNPDDPSTADRFEIVLHGIELANGFRELRDPREQAERFATDRERRAGAGAPDVLPDLQLLAALEAGLPDCAGVAVGLDRILLLTNPLGGLQETMSFTPGS